MYINSTCFPSLSILDLPSDDLDQFFTELEEFVQTDVASTSIQSDLAFNSKEEVLTNEILRANLGSTSPIPSAPNCDRIVNWLSDDLKTSTPVTIADTAGPSDRYSTINYSGLQNNSEYRMPEGAVFASAPTYNPTTMPSFINYQSWMPNYGIYSTGQQSMSDNRRMNFANGMINGPWMYGNPPTVLSERRTDMHPAMQTWNWNFNNQQYQSPANCPCCARQFSHK